jgi:Mn2+/Fe2+ NRAMP family transporter
MAAALHLLIDGPMLMYVAGFAIVTVLAEVFIRYSRYASVLRWLTLSLFAYVATVFVVSVPWLTVARDLVLPNINFSGKYLTVVVAVFGTTISPYLFFWQAGEEVEDEKEDPAAKALIHAPQQAPRQMARMRLDRLVGMGLSNIIALFIMLTTAATLHAHGVTDIQTSSQAAEALRPIAGQFAFTIFALGIIGTGMQAVPMLAGSVAYAVGEALHWRVIPIFINVMSKTLSMPFLKKLPRGSLGAIVSNCAALAPSRLNNARRESGVIRAAGLRR